MSHFKRFVSAEVERLEVRQLMAAAVRSIDGTGNNLLHPDWGSVSVDLLRKGPAAYADGVSAPAGSSRPSARVVSDAVSAADPAGQTNERNLSAFVYAWGQFLDHDLDLTTSASPAEAFSVTIPTGDPSFDPNSTGTQTIPLNRSLYDLSTGTSKSNPRQQVNTITGYIDGSVVYGSDAVRAAALRSFVGGKLKTSPGDLLPFNTAGLPNANDAHIFPDDQLFLAGDVRANENIELTALQTLFMREHNRIADQLAAANPKWTDEQIYQQARKTVGAEIQSITYNEFLPALLGQNVLTAYRGYNPRVNPGIANEFSTAAFRFGHSMLGDDIEFLDNNGAEVHDPVSLSQAFFNPPALEATGIDPILKYLSADRAQEIDTKVVDSVRNFLFGPPGAGGLDLASLNIQRGRDHGLEDYNSARAAYGLPRVKTFAQITSDPQLQLQLQNLYGSVDNVDLWVGGLAETHVRGGSLGPTFTRILADQFQRTRDGDRFWFENQFSGRQLATLENTSLADIVRRNSTTTNVQDNVFVFNVTASGMVYNDLNANGRQDRRERGMVHWTVNANDDAGNIVDSTTTDLSGRYLLSGMELGTYSIEVVEPNGWTQTTHALAELSITRGTDLKGINFGYAQGSGSSATLAAVSTPATTLWTMFDQNVHKPDDSPAGELLGPAV